MSRKNWSAAFQAMLPGPAGRSPWSQDTAMSGPAVSVTVTVSWRDTDCITIRRSW